MKKKPMPDQGIGTASYKRNLPKGARRKVIGSRSTRGQRVNIGNQEPHMPGKDFLPSKAGMRRMRMMKKAGLKTLERKR
jgi:hypothetical protein